MSKSYTANAQNRIVAFIAGKPVDEAEYRFHLLELRTACMDFFTQRYGVYNGADFWTHDFDRQKPCDWLKKAAFRKCIEDRAALQFMSAYGVLKNFSFSRLDTLAFKENLARTNAIAEGKPVYGNTRFDQSTYYSYLMSNAMLETKRKFIIKEPASIPVLKNYYEHIKAEKFKIPDSRILKLIRTLDGGLTDSLTLTFNADGRKKDELEWGIVFNKAQLLAGSGQELSFTDDGGNRCVLKCLSYSANGYLDFQKVIDNTRDYYANALIAKRICQIIKRSVLKVNQPVCNAVFAGL